MGQPALAVVVFHLRCSGWYILKVQRSERYNLKYLFLQKRTNLPKIRTTLTHDRRVSVRSTRPLPRARLRPHHPLMIFLRRAVLRLRLVPPHPPPALHPLSWRHTRRPAVPSPPPPTTSIPLRSSPEFPRRRHPKPQNLNSIGAPLPPPAPPLASTTGLDSDMNDFGLLS
jgi:hypothetical protein